MRSLVRHFNLLSILAKFFLLFASAITSWLVKFWSHLFDSVEIVRIFFKIFCWVIDSSGSLLNNWLICENSRSRTYYWIQHLLWLDVVWALILFAITICSTCLVCGLKLTLLFSAAGIPMSSMSRPLFAPNLESASVSIRAYTKISMSDVLFDSEKVCLFTFTSGFILESAPFMISKQDSCTNFRKILIRATSAWSSFNLISSVLMEFCTSFETAASFRALAHRSNTSIACEYLFWWCSGTFRRSCRRTELFVIGLCRFWNYIL